jgi:hypothetical protein
MGAGEQARRDSNAARRSSVSLRPQPCLPNHQRAPAQLLSRRKSSRQLCGPASWPVESTRSELSLSPSPLPRDSQRSVLTLELLLVDYWDYLRLGWTRQDGRTG